MRKLEDLSRATPVHLRPESSRSPACWMKSVTVPVFRNDPRARYGPRTWLRRQRPPRADRRSARQEWPSAGPPGASSQCRASRAGTPGRRRSQSPKRAAAAYALNAFALGGRRPKWPWDRTPFEPSASVRPVGPVRCLPLGAVRVVAVPLTAAAGNVGFRVVGRTAWRGPTMFGGLRLRGILMAAAGTTMMAIGGRILLRCAHTDPAAARWGSALPMDRPRARRDRREDGARTPPLASV